VKKGDLKTSLVGVMDEERIRWVPEGVGERGQQDRGFPFCIAISEPG
jgi:hypothetical protein